LFAGFLAADREKIVASLQGHDLILVLGAPVFTYHVEGFGAAYSGRRELVPARR
jgi:benzoylformate decarboxylase